MGRRDHPEPGVDGVDRARVELAVEEPDGIAQGGDGLVDALGDRVRVAARSPERVVLELFGVAERGALFEPRDAIFDARAQRGHRRLPQQRVVGLDVRVDRQHFDAARAQEPGQRRDRQVRRGGITRWRINEGDLHRCSGGGQYSPLS